ncbi:hypothetical protein GALL_470940 [mine drainage metagenome]|uniref:Uncharacterized protein n=1 Tax=mine drainage metagenome TaxID=410659 RepID=A0A1J5PJB2_9ZZZZ
MMTARERHDECEDEADVDLLAVSEVHDGLLVVKGPGDVSLLPGTLN